MLRDEIILIQSGFVEIQNSPVTRYSHTKLPILIDHFSNGYITRYLFSNGCESIINKLTKNVREAIQDGRAFARQPKSKIQRIGRQIEAKIQKTEEEINP